MCTGPGVAQASSELRPGGVGQGGQKPELEGSGEHALQVDSLPSELPGKSKNTGVGSLSLLHGIFLTQEFNRGLLHCRQLLYQLSGSLELIKFRESGIASEYESNTDESEERDSWSQEELPRLLNVLQRQELGDSLDDDQLATLEL